MWKILLPLVLIGSYAFAGYYEDTLQREQAYRSSPEYAQKVQAEKAAGSARLKSAAAMATIVPANSTGNSCVNA